MPKETPADKPKPPVPEVDVRSVSRRPDRCETLVILHWDWQTRIKWLHLGEARLRTQRERDHDGRWRLEAYLPSGVCDFEHDSAYLLRLPLIGVTFGGIEYHATSLTAWVDPNESEDFHVPPPGYNPMKHPDAEVCEGIYDEKKRKYCKWNEGKPHPIVPQGFYVPPPDLALYKLVRGKKLEITFSTALSKKERKEEGIEDDA